MIIVRQPMPIDTPEMASLLNDIIKEGGTTARTNPVTAKDMTTEIARKSDLSVWHVAFDARGALVGFQSVTPEDYLPPDAVDISTFVRVGRTGLGIGSALFEATRKAAKALGYSWINANIRADNEGGLIYYQSRGFEDYDVIRGYKMENGQIVDKRLKRFDL
ncbi:GNAT family N-acetyltransferase [Sulfitobacter aestuariivivens]|uniref:GNAT family N-acetyltransferase n=1 Tax=Sulfitobacter aestuariivivens TaxID=2766981 RepID=A0A927D6P3_9RHOB|nr:GNAT family N-acetyltransferase [Sulfitobacter aestuariivivens]MBD3665203.1 GNAT family N-acetyltransferase [Sulfitobacter aestuariivivens]